VSQLAEVLSELERRGVTVAAKGDTLCLSTRDALDDTLLARVRAAKPAILEALRGCQVRAKDKKAACGSPHCAGCYDIGEGRKIHPPKCGDDSSRWRAWLEGKGPRQ